MSVRPFFAALFGAIILALALPGLAWAQTVGTAGNSGGNLALINGQAFVGQIVSVPSTGLQIQSYTLHVGRNGPTLTVRPQVYEVVSISGGTVTVVSTPVWTGADQAVANTGANPFTFTPTLPVDAAKQYVVGVFRPTAGEAGNVYTATTSNYSGGETAIGSTQPTSQISGDLHFTAVFAPVPSPVPTLTEWAMILLSLALVGSAVVILSRRQRV